MKNLIWILLIFLSLQSCKTAKADYTKSDINSLSLYDYNNKPISLENLTKEWNKRIQENEEINARLENLEIINIVDNETNKKTLVLLGTTNKKSVKTATTLTEYKNGLKLSDLTVTCNNCNDDLNIQLNNKNWSCITKVGKSCTKITTLRTE